MSDDIVKRIDEFISTKDNKICKSSVIKILEYLIIDIPEDKVYLEAFKDTVSKHWSAKDGTLVNNFKKILSTYGVLNEDVERRSKMEKKGKTIIKRFIEPNHIEEIKELLEL